MAVIAEIPKRPGEVWRISVEEFHGQTRVNIRNWWQDDFGDWKPGKQGVSLPPATFREIWWKMQGVDAALKEEGL